MKTHSAKAKGRRLQQEVRDKLIEVSKLHPDDIRSTPMGSSGEDIMLSPAARAVFPWSIECKNVEKLSVWAAIDQARANAKDNVPVVVFTKNHEKTQVAVPFEYFMKLYKYYIEGNK
jgi:hypothetical protein